MTGPSDEPTRRRRYMKSPYDLASLNPGATVDITTQYGIYRVHRPDDTPLRFIGEQVSGLIVTSINPNRIGRSSLPVRVRLDRMVVIGQRLNAGSWETSSVRSIFLH